MMCLVCMDCGADLFMPLSMTLGQIRDEIERHGCEVRRVRWDGRIVPLVVQ